MTRAPVRLEPRFVDGPSGRLFMQVVVPAESPAIAAVLILPPIGEEMNKSRRMLSLQAQNLANKGVVAILPDLYGLGDSEGSVADASLEIWRADLEHICAWIVSAHKPQRLHLLALRSGALFLSMVDPMRFSVKSWILWSPEKTGARTVKNLYRQALITARSHSDSNISIAELREQTLRDGFIEVAGYQWPSALINELEHTDLPESLPPGVHAEWMDVRAALDSNIAPDIPPVVRRWDESCRQVRYQVVDGPPFWQTAEISTVPELIALTTANVVDARYG